MGKRRFNDAATGTTMTLQCRCAGGPVEVHVSQWDWSCDAAAVTAAPRADDDAYNAVSTFRDECMSY